MLRKSRSKNNESENIINSKGQVQFNQICKELEYLRIKIESCEGADKSKIVVLKDKLSALELKLDQVCSDNLSIDENEENFDTRMQYKDLIVEMSVELQGKMMVENKQGKNETLHESKTT